MFDHEVDENRPQVGTFWVCAQDFVKHVATSLYITVTELQLSELGDHIHTWEKRMRTQKRLRPVEKHSFDRWKEWELLKILHQFQC